MNQTNLLAVLLPLVAVFVGCAIPVVGNSPEERKHREAIQIEEDSFNRQKYERRYAPAVQETEAYHTFTNRLSQRDTEPMDLVDLGRVMVEFFGTNIAWQVVCTAYGDYSHGAQLEQATNVIWLLGQSPRTRDTAWMINFREQWMDGQPTDAMASEPLSPLSQKIQKRDGTNFIGQYLGMIAEISVGTIWPSTNVTKDVWMYSATSGELLRLIPYDEFRSVYVLKTKPEYPSK